MQWERVYGDVTLVAGMELTIGGFDDTQQDGRVKYGRYVRQGGLPRWQRLAQKNSVAFQ